MCRGVDESLLRWLHIVLAAISCSACHPTGASPAPHAPPGAARDQTVVFRGTCDASGAVLLSDSHFAVGDDEDNVLRVYDTAGGDPLYTIDVSPALDLPRRKKVPEADIEAATRLGDRALWLTSHGRSSKGELQPSRFRFFATSAPTKDVHLAPVGTAYHGLLDDLLQAPQLASFGLREAIELAPKAGGLNIEGMTRRPDGRSVMIGFRNPRPNGRALLVPLLNPLALIEGEHAKFGEPVLLRLGGLGVRSLSLWRGRYLIIAGAMDKEAPSLLYVWDGTEQPQLVRDAPLVGLNPEAFVSRDESDRVLLLSDDGSYEVGGQPCKKLKDRRQKQFRGVWVRVPE